MSRAEELKRMQQDLLAFGNGPLFSQMPHYTLEDKGIAGPTAAHRIEEVHTPLNLAYLTFTTGSSAFQNIVGVTHQELRQAAHLLQGCGLPLLGTVLNRTPY